MILNHLRWVSETNKDFSSPDKSNDKHSEALDSSVPSRAFDHYEVCCVLGLPLRSQHLAIRLYAFFLLFLKYVVY